ncbi:OsmC family protein [Streptosporangium sp. CA-135522]|uniref:OsmC family protein n=1 Tax=Streptosporangium sp. CA-135522 TaxID=3240072 RepID=UPI003D8B8001
MYAERKGWALEGVSVSLRHSRVHARDCADCESGHGLLDRIEVVIELDEPLDEQQRRRLMEIADKCSVHRTLRSQVLIERS